MSEKFKEMHKANLMMFIEPKISGIQVGRMIIALRFSNSHSVKEHDFFRVIWLV